MFNQFLNRTAVTIRKKEGLSGTSLSNWFEQVTRDFWLFQEPKDFTSYETVSPLRGQNQKNLPKAINQQTPEDAWV